MKKMLIIISIPLMFLLLRTEAFSTGIGWYFNGGGGLGFLDLNRMPFKEVASSGQYLFGGGLVVDTCLAQDKLFNYRLHLGYDYIAMDLKSRSAGIYEAKFNRINIFNNFGFGIVRNKLLRFWIGPQLGLRCQFGDISGKENPLATAIKLSNLQNFAFIAMMSSSTLLINTGITKNIVMTGLSLGLATGLNLNLTDLFTLSIECGARYGIVAMLYITQVQSQGGTTTSVEHELMHGLEGYAAISCIFRFNDNYQKDTDQKKLM